MSSWKSVVPLALAVTLILGGCDDRVVEPQDGTTHVVALLPTSSGELVSKAEMEIRTKEVARAVALALANETVRTYVYEAMRASPIDEEKLHFGSFFEEEGGALRNEMSLRSGKSAAELRGLLDGVIDLEFYMPVDEHRAQWRGGEDLIVATVLDDEGSVPVGFDLLGQGVILDADEPPMTPALVLVPVETDFEVAASEFEFAASYSGGDGIYMTSSTINDDFEAWPLGDPEFEVHAFRRDSAGDYQSVSCASEHQSGYYYFDQVDDWTWHGEVLLITETAADTGKIQLQYWEDDGNECDGTGDGRPPGANSLDAEQLEDWGSDVIEILRDTTKWLEKGVKVAYETVVLALDTFDDDMIGVIEWPLVSCWPEATGAIWADIISEDTGHAKEGYVRIDTNFGTRDPLCALSTTISGPTEITTCPTMITPDPEPSYSASYSGSSGTPSFQWIYDGGEVGTNSSSYEIPNDDLTDGTHVLEIVTTRGGEIASDHHTIEVTEESTCGGMD
jgi:hypothetical protein